ncbi:MAG: iron-containing alcohol dehydrogenase [Actinobacteria bacterium]|nr:iron-containing alcohol dehydrogenase [Actinomycetota bacterium]
MNGEFKELIAAMTATRQIALPRFLRAVEGHDALDAELRQVLEALEVSAPLYVSGTSQSAAVCADLTGSDGNRDTITDNTRAEVKRIATRLQRDHDAIVAVGGGRPVDVAKAAALIADEPVIVIPTQLSTDGIASPVAVIREASGDVVSERAQLPVAVVADLEAVAAAPAPFARAGIGDLISNRTALFDWRLAATAGAEQVDDFAALLSACAHLLIESFDLSELCAGRVTVPLARRLLDGLVLSGLAMEIAGSSRPCSGSEHLISHALDGLEPGTASHGEQVAFGTLVATRLQGGDVGEIRELIASAGMTSALAGFGIPTARLAEIVKCAPGTRPGRYTILDHEPLSTRELRAELDRLLAC